MPPEFDPFADLEDEPALTPSQVRTRLLSTALRGYTPLRKVLVQKPNTESSRAAALADIVRGRHHRALDALLLIHALQPILDGSPLPLAVWATLLSTRSRCTRAAASNTFDELVDLALIDRSTEGRVPVVQPLLEDQSGRTWSRPGVAEEEGPGYFTLPHGYWVHGYAERLRLPGKAMFLILLAETQNPKTPAFSMPVARAQEWYGLSERTAERGYTELSSLGLLLVRRVKRADPRHPAGRRDVYWRALTSPFNTVDRAKLQEAATRAAREKARAEGGEPATGDVVDADLAGEEAST